MIKNLSFMIDNANAYYYSGKKRGIVRDALSRGLVRASDDIESIDEIAGKCINTIDKCKKHK